eukprot:tig00000889_g5331.t1
MADEPASPRRVDETAPLLRVLTAATKRQPRRASVQHKYVLAAEPKEAVDTSWRAVVVLLCAFSIAVAYADRSNLSVAIIAIRAELHWSQQTVGLILGAFWWGYLATQVLGGWLSHRVGGRRVLAGGIALCSAAAFLHRPAAALGAPCFFGVRVLVGLAEGVAFPAIHALLADWVPQAESSRAVAVVTSASYLGTIAANAASPPLLAAHGWPSVFYLFGAVGLAWLPPWLWLSSDKPEHHPRIGPGELARITSERPSSRPGTPVRGRDSPARSRSSSPAPLIGTPVHERVQLLKRPVPVRASPPTTPRSSSLAGDPAAGYGTPRKGSLEQAKTPAKVPWRGLLAAPEVWAIILNQFTNSWGFYVLLSWLPAYFFDRFKTRIEELPFFVVAPYVAQAGAGLAAGFAADALVKRGAPLLAVRRVFQVVGMVGPAVFTLLAAFHADTPGLGAAYITAGLGLNAFTLAGVSVNHLDIAPLHAGLVFAMGNSAGQLAGLVAVPLTGTMLSRGWPWASVFALGAALYVVGAAAWLLLAGAEVLPLEEAEPAPEASPPPPPALHPHPHPHLHAHPNPHLLHHNCKPPGTFGSGTVHPHPGALAIEHASESPV